MTLLQGKCSATPGTPMGIRGQLRSAEKEKAKEVSSPWLQESWGKEKAHAEDKPGCLGGDR